MRAEDYLELVQKVEKLTLDLATVKARHRKDAEKLERLDDAYREKHGGALKSLLEA